MKYDHAKPLIEELMHIAVLFHASGMLRTKIFDALKEFVPDMDDGCFERGCPAIDHFSSHTTTQDDELKKMVEKGTKAWADIPDDWVADLRGGIESCTEVGTNSGVLHKEWAGLTIDEIDKFMPYCHSDHDLSEFRTFAFEIEAKLKEKNA
jgi:hypothetical protein